jgi:diaminopimelate epimerase
MRFFKYHGTGNDFILIENLQGSIKEVVKSMLAKKLCDRHFGVGGDGLILIEPSERADAKMRIFNPNGSEAEMCGNGIRCTGKFLYETGTRKERILIDTLAGVKELKLTIEKGEVLFLTADMGAPRDISLNKKLEINSKVWDYSFVDTGVPHVVIFVEDIESIDMKEIAPAIRYNPLFPKGANVNFVEMVKRRLFKIRTYERGVEKETLACGTGITAAGVVPVLQGLIEDDEELEFKANGGILFVKTTRENRGIRIFMRGPAEFVFEGEIPLELD